jgi:hypothetical protein
MKLTEGGKLERPNVCFLCETTPAAGSKVIDTERYFDGWPANLHGRRYVCERCINDMVKFFEFTTLEHVRQAQLDVLERDAIIRGIKLRLDALYGDIKRLTENPNVFSQAQPIEFPSVEVKGIPLETGTTIGATSK